MNPKTNYQRKLGNPLWQRKRSVICNRDNWTCQHCGDKETELQVHHLRYRKGVKPWEYEDAELLTLCANCHFKVTLIDLFDRNQLDGLVAKLAFSFGNCKGDGNKLEAIIDLIYRLSTCTEGQVNEFVLKAEVEAAKFL